MKIWGKDETGDRDPGLGCFLVVVVGVVGAFGMLLSFFQNLL